MAHVLSAAEREAFLALPHVAVISIAMPGRGPLTVPIWYQYAAGGELGLWMDGTSAKARALLREGRFSLCVQDTTRPYRYVSVEGPVTRSAPIDLEAELRPLVARYLGAAGVDAYLATMGGAEGLSSDLYCRMRPERWRAEQL